MEKVLCLDTRTEYYFTVNDSLDALKKMICLLNLKSKQNIEICETKKNVLLCS